MPITTRPNIVSIISNSLPNELEYLISTLQPSEQIEIWDNTALLETLQYSSFNNLVSADISQVLNAFFKDEVFLPNANAFVLDTNLFKEFYIKTTSQNDIANKRFVVNGRNTELNFDYLPYCFLPTSFGLNREVKILNKIFPIPFYENFGSIISTFFVKDNGNYIDALTNTQQFVYNGASGLLRFRVNEIDTNGLATFGFRGYDNLNNPYCASPNFLLERQTCYEKVLFWVNSLGGIDSFTFKGYEKTFEVVISDNYLPYPLRNIKSLKRIKKEITKLSTYVLNSQIQAFCEIYTSNNVFLFENGNLLPVNIRNEGEILFQSNKKGVFEMNVNIERYINE